MALARRAWDQFDPADLDGSWARLGQRLTVAVGIGQLAATQDAGRYVTDVLEETGQRAPAEGRIVGDSLAGVASDGRPLDSLLYGAVVNARAATAQGMAVTQAMSQARSWLDLAVSTQVQDAGRQAVGIGIAVRPKLTGYVRMVNPPCCSRCALLAGRHYKWNAGFSRHPRCDCRHIPASEDMAGTVGTSPDALVRSGQIRGLSKADASALADGADLGQVVNSRRGRQGMATTEGASRRGVAGARLQGRRRLTPEGIYRVASDRAEAIDLLRANGYILR